MIDLLKDFAVGAVILLGLGGAIVLLGVAMTYWPHVFLTVASVLIFTALSICVGVFYRL